MANGTRPSYHPGLAYRFNPMLPSVGQAMELQQRQEEAERQRQAQQQQQIKENRAEYFEKITNLDYETLTPELNKIVVDDTQQYLDLAAQIRRRATQQNRETTPDEKYALEKERSLVDGRAKSLESFNEAFRERAEQIKKNEQGIYNDTEARDSLISVLENIETEDGDLNVNVANSKTLDEAIWGNLKNFDLTQVGENHEEKINEMIRTKTGVFDDNYQDTEYKTKLVKYDKNGNPVMDDGMPVLEDSDEAVNFFLQNPTNKKIVELMKDENPDMTNREAYREIMAPHIQFQEDIQRSSRSTDEDEEGGPSEDKTYMVESVIDPMVGYTTEPDESVLQNIVNVAEGVTSAEYINEPLDEGQNAEVGPARIRLVYRADPNREGIMERLFGPGKTISEETDDEEIDGKVAKELTFPIRTREEKESAMRKLKNLVNMNEPRAQHKISSVDFERVMDRLEQKRRDFEQQQPDPQDPEGLFEDE